MPVQGHKAISQSQKSWHLLTKTLIIFTKKTTIKDSKTIAVDFDGTIVENAYPNIGKPMLFAFETLKKLQNEGHILILWTYRNGSKLEEAVEFCKERGLVFYAVNKSYPEEKMSAEISRKIHADIFIDDRDVRGMLGWGEIYQILGNDPSQGQSLKKKRSKKKKKKSSKGGFMKRIEELFKDDNY